MVIKKQRIITLFDIFAEKNGSAIYIYFQSERKRLFDKCYILQKKGMLILSSVTIYLNSK